MSRVPGITVLGPVTVEDDGGPLSPRDRVVLSVLVVRRGREVAPDSLAEALWRGEPPASWSKVVQGCVARLRRRLGAGAIVTGPGGYRLAVPAQDVDANRFERLVQRARELTAVDHPDQAAYAADEALGLWQGHPLTDVEDWEPGRGEGERLAELHLQTEELRLGALLASGRHGEVLPEAALRVQEEPLREHRWALLARAQYQDGRQAEALTTLRRARRTLADQLGIDPGTELVELEQAVLQQDPGLAVAAAGSTAAVCPWPGLASYDVGDGDIFYGREKELAECLERLADHGLLAVVGPSGSGKSSLARAGLAARLREQGRTVRIITPGPRPLDALATAVDGAAPGGGGARAGRVLVVDQCEDVFAAEVPTSVRATFLAGVAAQVGDAGALVVLTLRADRLGELAAHPELARLVEDGLYLLGRIGPEELRASIEQPARRAGLLLEHGLVDLLVREVEGEPGSLPLLSHALRQTWERREGGTLTVQGYQASGGIRGAVAQSAEQVYEEADAEQRRAVRELLLRMVQPGPGGEPVRTSVARDVVRTVPGHAVVVEQLVRARLLTADAERVEIAHEALARAWPRLQAWLADDVQGELIRHHLAAAAAAWEAMGRPGSELYRGARLLAAGEWRDAGRHHLTTVEADFLSTSEQAHRSKLARAQDEARRARRVNRRLRVLVAGTVLLALVAAAFGTVAGIQWRGAQEAKGAAEDNAVLARSHQLSAAAVGAVDQDPALARALAVLSAMEAPTGLEARDALHRTLAADRVVSRLSMSHPVGRLWAVLHPDGDRVVMTGEHVYEPALAIEVQDAMTGDLLWEWVRPDEPEYGSVFVAGAQYSPDGAVLASGMVLDPWSTGRLGPAPEDAPLPPDGVLGVHLWDARTHDELGVLDVGPCGGWPVAVAGDHLLVRTLVAPSSPDAEAAGRVVDECRWDEGTLGTVLVDLRTGRLSHLVATEQLNLHLTVGHALSDDGSLAAVPDFDSWTTVLVDTSTGEEVRRLPDLLALDLDPAGEHLLGVDVSTDGTDVWRVVPVDGQGAEMVYTGRSTWSTYGTFSADGATVWTTGLENTLVQWDARTSEHLRSLPAVGSGAPSAQSGLVLVPQPQGSAAVLVDALPPGELWSAPGCGGTTGQDLLRVTADRVVVGRECGGTQEGLLETWTRRGEPVDRWADASWEFFEVSPDGRYAVARVGAGNAGARGRTWPQVGPLSVLDLRTGEVVTSLRGFCTHGLVPVIANVAPEELDLDRCRDFPQQPFSFMVRSPRWSPDERWIAAVNDLDGSGVGVWDARTGELVAAVAAPGSSERARWGTPYDLRFSEDSRRLYLSTQDRFVVALGTGTWEQRLGAPADLLQAGSAGLVGFDGDGSLVVVAPLYQVTTDATIALLDPETLSVRRSWSSAAEGAAQSAAISPDGARLAIATTEGLVTVWDLTTGSLIDRADPGLGRLDGVRWLDRTDLVLLSANGHLSTATTNPDRLLALARRGLTRGLTEAECASYRVSPCPDLAELAGAEGVVPEDLRGTWSLTWEPEEIRGVVLDWGRRSFGELDDASVGQLRGRADLAAGTSRLELRGSDYTLTSEDDGATCTGSVTSSESRPGRLRLRSDDGQRCPGLQDVEVGWELDGDRLVLPREQFRGDAVAAVFWTGKAWSRTG